MCCYRKLTFFCKFKNVTNSKQTLLNCIVSKTEYVVNDRVNFHQFNFYTKNVIMTKFILCIIDDSFAYLDALSRVKRK